MSEDGRPITQIERCKLGGDIRAALASQLAEGWLNRTALTERLVSLNKAIDEMEKDLAWIDHGVRVGSIIKFKGYHRPNTPKQEKLGQVVGVLPSPDSSVKPYLIVAWALKAGGWGALGHTLYNRDWEVVTE